MDSLSIIILCSVISFAIGLIPACQNFAKEIIVSIVESGSFLLGLGIILGISFWVMYSIPELGYEKYEPGNLGSLLMGFLIYMLALIVSIPAVITFFIIGVFISILKIWIPESIIIKLWVPALIFFLPALPKAFENANLILESKEKIKQVEKRKKQAIKRRIIEKAERIVNVLGDGSFYKDRDMQISRPRGEVEILSISGTNSNTVFIGKKVEGGGFFYGDPYYKREVDELGDVKYVKEQEYHESYTEHIIDSYIPGPWEEYFENLFSKTEKQAEKQEEINTEMKLKKERDDLKKRFGL
ncbi:hypothetical protein UR09_06295 [Candidatus Nitromaritima sp. SCGC AAA799-A02]|nr:hypothetical protein UR09_06295 [Candidatus Nitromaritima sp. SCGC AAA799-A02]